MSTENARRAYGRFERGGRSYLINDIDTPTPWVNVLSNDRYGLVLSQQGGGFSWLGNCQLFRLNRWEQDLVTDPHGRFLLVQPEGKPTEYVNRFADQVEHGIGWTTFHKRIETLEASMTVFLPDQRPYEAWVVELTHHGDAELRLHLGLYLEWHLGSQGDWHREFHRLFAESEEQGDTLLAWKHPGLEEGRRTTQTDVPTAFVRWLQAPSHPLWVTDKRDFVSARGIRPLDEIAARHATSHYKRWDDPIAGSLLPLVLQPGQSVHLVLAIGGEESRSQAIELAQALDPLAILHARNALQHPPQLAVHVCTPVPEVDAMVNYWLPYQAEVGRMKARCAYYQQGGAYGFRDQLQDSLCLLSKDPSLTFQQLIRHAEATYEDGGVRHWWHPGTPISVPSKHSDTCLWLSYGTLAYLDETADLACLEVVHQVLSRITEGHDCSRTLLETCRRGVERALERRSPRGLPYIGHGDWNDGLSHVGVDGDGESVWVAMFLYDILRRWSPWLHKLGLGELAERWESEAESLRRAVEAHAWDGEWYIAGTRDDGAPFGSAQCKEGQIFLNPQIWAVLTGIASEDRTRAAMQKVKERLIRPYGALLLAPAYSKVDPYIGYITRYAPGLRENGGVYSHASTWAVRAFAELGDTETAYSIFGSMLPPLRSALDPDRYAAEPYVMPGNVDGPDSPFEGKAGWTWYTGSAAWMHRVFLESILGVQATPEGLVVRPCLPPEWHGKRVLLERPFRGEVYRFTFEPAPGPLVVSVDGAPVSGALPLSGRAGAVHEVQVQGSRIP